MNVRPLADADRSWVRDLVANEWGLPVVTPAAVYDSPEMLHGVVAEIDGARAGVVTYTLDKSECEVVVVISTQPGVGAGRAMLEDVRRRVREQGGRRVWLITSDDTGAAAFYSRLGMTMCRTHPNFIDIVRQAKPDVSGFDDAYEYEWVL